MVEPIASLRVQNVTKRFGDFTAVENLSFEVHAGRVFGFLGPNGAGKTTTIRMIVGITAPDDGIIEYGFGSNRTDARDKTTPSVSVSQDRIGYLPEERGLYKKMKVVDQLRYFAALKNVPRPLADERIDFWLARMRLSDWKNKKTTDLSKGMQQKIQFVATVLHDPDLLILDEPFSGLDPVNVEFMIEVLAELKARNKTVIFSTHVMETAERLCNDILLINKSKKVIGGSLREIKQSYGRNLIALRAVGAEQILADRNLAASVEERSDEVQVELAKGANAQMLLRKLINAGAMVTKFETVEPSLNDIFIDQVGDRAKPLSEVAEVLPF